MKDISELDQSARRLRVSWDKANNYYSSFSQLFLEIQAEFKTGVYGSEWTFVSWLGRRAGLSEDQCLKQMKNFANVIAGDSNEKVAEQLRQKELEKKRAKLESEKQKAALAEETLRVKADKQAKLDAVKLAKEREKQSKIDEAAREKKRANDRAYRQRKRQATVPLESVSDIIKELQALQIKENQMRPEWIERTIKTGVLLVKLRKTFPSDIEFSKCLVDNALFYSPHNQAAYIGLGYNPRESRKVLEETDSYSLELIWRKMKQNSTVIPIA